MKQINFYKMVASGNDFVVVDNRQKEISDPISFTREVCRFHTGIGADGVLLIENSKKADYKMRIINPDGSEAEACGNGFRCAALLAQKLGFSKQQRFESLSGMIEAEIKGERVRVRMPDPAEYRNSEKIDVKGRGLHYYFIRTGVPHVVIFVEGISKVPVFEIGKEIRFHPRFKPAGTNVNFVEIKGPESIEVRTYERGVEQETLACGTGSTASAVISTIVGYIKPPVRVKTQSGEVLTVDFQRKGEKIQDLFLEGEAKFVFEGTVPVLKAPVL